VRALRDHGLSIALLGIFVLFLAGESIAGLGHENENRREHGQPEIAYLSYVRSSSFIETTLENWESEFLEMAAYVVLTAFLFQKGSAESKKLDEPEEVDRAPSRSRKDAPWPVRRGGFVLAVYQNSLSLGFFGLFLLAFIVHLVSGARDHSSEQVLHGGEAVSTLDFLKTPTFWFQSLQNWQSEFLGIGAMVLLSIFLRQKGSPESKPVDAPHYQTGGA
jgi:hypothetical protein